jgi:drug/metabolite transporter (DMT)-like permease
MSAAPMSGATEREVTGATAGAPRGDARGVLGVLAAAAMMGTLGPVAAVAYGEGIGPATFSALRAAIGGAFLGGLVVTGRQPSIDLARLPGAQRRQLALAVAVNGLMNLALFLAFGAMAIGLVMVVYYTYPAIVALLSAVLGRERLTPLRVFAIAVASAGLALVIGGQLTPDAHATGTGLALAAVAATGQAIYLVVIRDGFDDVPAAQATSLVLAGGLLISGVAAIVMRGPGVIGSWLASPLAWLAILCAGTFGALPKVWIIGGVRRIGSTRAAVVMTVEPVVAVVVAALVLGQQLTPIELLGGGAILAAVVLVQVPARAMSSRATGDAR